MTAILQTVMLLVVVMVVIAVLAQRLKLAPSILLVIAGIHFGYTGTVEQDHLKQALAVQLDQSPYLNLLPESKVQEALTKASFESGAGEGVKEFAQALQQDIQRWGEVVRQSGFTPED